MTTVVTIVFAGVAAFFFIAGTIGLLRFPDTLCRLHAITKADNLALGFTVAAVMVQAGSAETAVKLAAIWALAVFSSAHICFVVAHAAVRSERP